MKVHEKEIDFKPGSQASQRLKETQIAIHLVKRKFEQELEERLGLMEVTAPLFVKKDSGINDHLNGVERPIAFEGHALPGQELEIVHSLAKWKRVALKRLGLQQGEGLFARMNAIRRDECLDSMHSFYVDQWDWEMVIQKSERHEGTLRHVVTSLYEALKATERYIGEYFPDLKPVLPEQITFVSSQELEDRYPKLTPGERENEAAKEYGAVFVMQIGGFMKSGNKHDGRSPDYDDWQLNGDIILWNPALGRAFEVSSMGIRVDETSLTDQLEATGCMERAELPFHQALLRGELPYSIGGGIGQSRLCMFLLRKEHIAEVQASVWPESLNPQFCGLNGV